MRFIAGVNPACSIVSGFGSRRPGGAPWFGVRLPCWFLYWVLHFNFIIRTRKLDNAVVDIERFVHLVCVRLGLDSDLESRRP
jgi:hypothetical protein